MDPVSLPRLGVRGLKLWRDVTESAPALKAAELEILLEACRTADRLEVLDEILSGAAETWMTIKLPTDGGGDELKLVVHGALAEARQQQNIFKQLVASLRIPDEASGKRPQVRAARGAYQPKGAGTGTVTALERARAAKAGA